jgi:nucleoid-associated protein YgaU
MTAAPPTRGKLRRQDNAGGPLDFHYNPTTITVTKMACWQGGGQRNSRTGTPSQEYTGGKPATLTMRLLFDAIDDSSRSVTAAVAKLTEWAQPTEKSVGKNTPQPPVLALEWGIGSTSYFPCRLKRVRIKYTLFSPEGAPVRATVDVSLVEVPNHPLGQNPTSGGVSGRRSVVLGAGDTLASVAYREYGDANLWRALAEANGVDDPLRLPPGLALLIPPRTEAAALAAVPAPTSRGDGPGGRHA